MARIPLGSWCCWGCPSLPGRSHQANTEGTCQKSLRKFWHIKTENRKLSFCFLIVSKEQCEIHLFLMARKGQHVCWDWAVLTWPQAAGLVFPIEGKHWCTEVSGPMCHLPVHRAISWGYCGHSPCSLFPFMQQAPHLCTRGTHGTQEATSFLRPRACIWVFPW